MLLIVIKRLSSSCASRICLRHSRYVMLAKIDSKDTATVINALIKHAHKLPRELYQSLTWDRGKEMADHKRFTLATDIKVYFCDPQNPWQRGSNENTNGLLRQYIPKGTDLSAYSQAKLNAVARRLNERPRKTLNYETPAERLTNLLRRSVESAANTGTSRTAQKPQLLDHLVGAQENRLRKRDAECFCSLEIYHHV